MFFFQKNAFLPKKTENPDGVFFLEFENRKKLCIALWITKFRSFLDFYQSRSSKTVKVRFFRSCKI